MRGRAAADPREPRTNHGLLAAGGAGLDRRRA
jgi:hypothetical protein